MRFRLLGALVACTAILAGSIALTIEALGGHTSQPAGRAPSFWGVHVNPPDPDRLGDVDRELDVARRSRANVVRVELAWWLLEPAADDRLDERYLSAFDHLVEGADRRGMRVLPVIWGTPCWASSAPREVRGECGRGSGRAKAYPPRDPAVYADVVGDMVRRYGQRMVAVEIWNEPDLEGDVFFAGADRERRYAELLKAAYPAVKRAAPGVDVLGGSLLDDDGDFLRALYREGIQGSYDGLAVHRYGLILTSLSAIREVQQEAGDETPLWLTEFGWTTCSVRDEAGHLCHTRGRQALALRDVVSALRRARFVRGAILYSARDDPHYDFGLVDREFRPKPALAAMRRALGRRRPLPPRRLTLRARPGAATGTAPAGDAVVLRAYPPGSSVPSHEAAYAPNPRGRYRWPLPSDVRPGWRVVAQQPWTRRSVTQTVR